MKRVAVLVFALGLLRVLLAEGVTAAQVYPWSTRTPTRTPRPVTPTPTRPVVPTIAATTPTPVPSSPPATPPPAGRGVTLQLSTFVTGVEAFGFEPVKYEVKVLGQWYTLTPRPGTCWSDNGACIALGTDPYLRITGRDGSVKEGPLRLSRPRILLAQSAGPINLIQFVTPQIQ